MTIERISSECDNGGAGARGLARSAGPTNGSCSENGAQASTTRIVSPAASGRTREIEKRPAELDPPLPRG